MKNKLLALKLLKQKIHHPSLTFSLISEKTGYSKRQLIRLSHSLDGSMDMEALCRHANEGKEPVNKALGSEIQFLIDLKSHIFFYYVIAFPYCEACSEQEGLACSALPDQPFSLT